jgi:hypothetical protein
MSELNQELETQVTEGENLPSVSHVEPKLFVGMVTLILLGVYVVMLMLSMMRNFSFIATTPVLIDDSTLPVVNPSLPKVDLAQEHPGSFTSDFAPATSTPLQQSYEITYAEGTQGTIVFSTDRSAQSLYEEYKSRLTDSRWVIMNTHESAMVYAVYALKEKKELNITMHQLPAEAGLAARTQITISHFSK